MSGYAVRFKRSTVRELESLPAQTVQRIMVAVTGLEENPKPRGCRKLRGQSETFRIRVGAYRVIYTIDDTERVVRVTRVRHRREAYD